METNPTWMGDNAAILGNLQLSHTFIPGTHDSAAYTGAVTHKEGRVQKYVMAQVGEQCGSEYTFIPHGQTLFNSLQHLPRYPWKKILPFTV